MDVAAFITEFRRVTRDVRTPPLWPDADVLAFLNDALNEACERALLIEDRTTAACCTVTLEEGVETYPLHASVIRLKRVTYKGRAIPASSVEEEDAKDGLWESRTGAPSRYIETEGFIRLVPTPNATANDEDLDLTVYRRPLNARTRTGDYSAAPELNERYHLKLMDWMYHRAYSKRDAETFDQAKADAFENGFTASFGPKISADVQRKRRDRRPPIVRMGPW